MLLVFLHILHMSLIAIINNFWLMCLTFVLDMQVESESCCIPDIDLDFQIVFFLS